MTQCLGRVLYDNQLEGATASYSEAEEAGFELPYAIDKRDFSTFRMVIPAGNTVDVRYTWTYGLSDSLDGFAFFMQPVVGFYGIVMVSIVHDTGMVETTLATTSVDLSEPWTWLQFCQLVSAQSISAGESIIFRVTGPASNITLDVREWSAGVVLTFPIGQRDGVPRFGHQFGQVTSSVVSINGSIIARDILRREKQATIDLPYVNLNWVETYWDPFLRYAERYPFFYSWHTDPPIAGVNTLVDPVWAAASEISPVVNMIPAPLLKVGMSIVCVDGLTNA